MTAADLLAALQPIVEALETLGVRHMLGGSLASSVHGVPRTSIDGDLVADLEPQHVAPLLQRLGTHLQTMFKIDVFVPKQRPFDRQALERAALDKLADAPVVGVLKTSPGLDHQYLQRWSAELGVSDLLEKAVEDASGGG